MATKPRTRPLKERKPNSSHVKRVNDFFTKEILEEIEILAGRGLTNEMIYSYYGLPRSFWFEAKITNPDIEKACLKGKAKTISMVSGKLMEKIRQGNLTAIIFYLKTQARWSEHSTVGIEKEDSSANAPLTITVNDPVEASKIYQQIMTGS